MGKSKEMITFASDNITITEKPFAIIDCMTNIELDMIQTAGVGALALIVGMVLTRKVNTILIQSKRIPQRTLRGILLYV